MNNTIAAFLADPTAREAFISGRAGTGKTTMIRSIVEGYSNKCIVVAHTHKAKGVLISKLPETADVRTLHSFLTKRPTINVHAKHVKHITLSKVQGCADDCKLLIVDEYSNSGESDYMDIGAIQDLTGMKVIYVGDSYQLPPVKDLQAIEPHGEYQVVLTKVHRTNSMPLLSTLSTLVSYIEDPSLAKPLEAHETLIRGQDLVSVYNVLQSDKVILAYTNRTVQKYNRELMLRDQPLLGDKIFCSSNQRYYTFIRTYEEPSQVWVRDEILELRTKYKTLEHLHTLPIQFFELEDEEGNSVILPCVFGCYDFKMLKEKYQRIAVNSNKAIEDQCTTKAKEWSEQHKRHPLARARAEAWRDFLCFNDCTTCIDFTHALTVHKSQGSTYESVLIDTNDLAICADIDFKMYLRLTYVAISRASKEVYTT